MSLLAYLELKLFEVLTNDQASMLLFHPFTTSAVYRKRSGGVDNHSGLLCVILPVPLHQVAQLFRFVTIRLVELACLDL